MGAIGVHEFMSLDGVVDAPTWTFEYGFTPEMEKTLGAVTERSRGILLGRNTYEAFEPAKARELARRVEFRYTPKHGSWLNVAESELSVMTRQCLADRRFETIERLRDEAAAWQARANGKQRGVDWQFKVEDARTKLKSLYPKSLD